MKAVFLTASLLATAFFVLIPSPDALAQANDEDFWLDEEDMFLRQVEPSNEFIERALNSIKETDPNKAAELKRLSAEDPNKFRTELRNVMRDHYGHRRRADKDPNDRRGEQEQRDMNARMRQTYEEYLKWLPDAYPDEAQKLAELKDAKPELYGRMLAISFRRHYRVYEAAKEDPKLADILKEDALLKKQREDLCKKIAAAKDPEQKAQLTAELQTVVSRRFDLIIARKLIAYERLSAELARLQKEVEQKGAEMQQWKDEKVKKQIIDAHLKDLLSEDRKFKWE